MNDTIMMLKRRAYGRAILYPGNRTAELLVTLMGRGGKAGPASGSFVERDLQILVDLGFKLALSAGLKSHGVYVGELMTVEQATEILRGSP